MNMDGEVVEVFDSFRSLGDIVSAEGGAKCPYGEVPLWRSVRTAKCPRAKSPVTESQAFYNKFGFYAVVLRKRYNITKPQCVSWVKSLSETKKNQKM